MLSEGAQTLVGISRGFCIQCGAVNCFGMRLWLSHFVGRMGEEGRVGSYDELMEHLCLG